jgi:hypothetical protein
MDIGGPFPGVKRGQDAKLRPRMSRSYTSPPKRLRGLGWNSFEIFRYIDNYIISPRSKLSEPLAAWSPTLGTPALDMALLDDASSLWNEIRHSVRGRLDPRDSQRLMEKRKSCLVVLSVATLLTELVATR